MDRLSHVLNSSILGRWPEKSVKFITRLLKNAESNADAKNIDLEDLYIKSIVVQQAPVCLDWLENVITKTYLLLPENSSSHLPRSWSHQPLSGTSLPCRDHPFSIRFRGRAGEGQGCYPAITDRPQQASSGSQAH
jgi:hypothetical protein